MDTKIKEMQERVLRLFSKEAQSFALAGGTALELYYLQHRFSWDLDFFSPKYDPLEIERLISLLRRRIDKRLALESELVAANQAKVRFYTLPVKGASRPLKIDFVEDVLFKKPIIRKKEGVRVYSVENIYFQKITAVSGTRPTTDTLGRTIQQGLSTIYQKGIVHWYRTFSRQDLKLALLELDIYDPRFNSREMIAHLNPLPGLKPGGSGPPA